MTDLVATVICRLKRKAQKASYIMNDSLWSLPVIASDMMDDGCDLISGAHYCLNWRKTEENADTFVFGISQTGCRTGGASCIGAENNTDNL